MRWARAEFAEAGAAGGGGGAPGPRSGHAAAAVASAAWGGPLVVVHGGLSGKRFLGDVSVLHCESGAWFRPCAEGTGPGPRAFHAAAVVGPRFYVFGGRTGSQKHADAWALDTGTWEWQRVAPPAGAEADKEWPAPSPRDFAAIAPGGPGKLLLVGGYDRDKWLNDVHLLDLESGAWQEVRVPGPGPPPRSGHSLLEIHSRVLMYGGEAANGQILGDLWALRGARGDEPLRWVRMQLGGSSPQGRSGHSLVSVGKSLVLFGGHGDGGWIQRKDVYLEDVHVLNRETVRWGRAHFEAGLPGPTPRAYHSMTVVGEKRALLFGGFDGTTTFGEAWWLDPSDPEGAPPDLPEVFPQNPAEAAPPSPAGAPAARVDAAAGGGMRGALSSTAELLGSLGKNVGTNMNTLITRGRGGTNTGLDMSVSTAEPAQLEREALTPGKMAEAIAQLRAEQDAEQAREVAGYAARFENFRLSQGLHGVPPDHGGRFSAAMAESRSALIALGMQVLQSQPLPERARAPGTDVASAATSAARAYLRSLGPEDLRLGDLPALVHDYRAAVASCGAVPLLEASEGGPAGRFLHVDAGALRLSDAPALLRDYHRFVPPASGPAREERAPL